MKECDGCGKVRSDVRCVGSNGDGDGCWLCFVCLKESARGRVFVRGRGYVKAIVLEAEVMGA